MEDILPPFKKKTRLRYRVAVIGGGSWATAIVKILSSNLEHIHWWVREEEIVEGISKYGHNPKYLSSTFINPKDVKISNDLRQVVSKADYVVIVTPSAFLQRTLEPLKKSRLNRKKIITAVKGIIPETNQVVTEYLHNCFGIDYRQMAVCIGPTHAEEVAREQLTFITAASPNPVLAEIVMQQLHCRYINITRSSDMRGIQYATALKNVYAVAAGICKGMGSGDNLMAVLVSYAIAEMRTFLQVMQPDQHITLSPENMPPYVGDLLVTCYSQLSRNRTFGTMIGRGYTVKSAQLEMHMIAEGYYAVKSLEKVRQEHNIDMPIAQTVYMILYENARPDVILRAWQIRTSNNN